MKGNTNHSDEQPTNDIDRKVLSQLSENRALSHDELCEKIDIQWNELQKSIRRLRNNDDVVITIDRRYVATETNQDE